MPDLEKYVEKLLQALDDDRVKAKISGLINKSDDSQQANSREKPCGDKTAELSDLQKKLEEAVSKANDMENRICSLEIENQKLTGDLFRKNADFEKYQGDKNSEIQKLKNEKAELMENEKRLEDEKRDFKGEIFRLAEYAKQLESDKKALESESAKLVKDHEKIKKDNAALKSQYEDALKREKLLESYVGKPLSVYLEYQKVSEDKRANLRAIISDKNVIAFVSSGSRQNTLDSLWDYIKNLIFTNDDPEEICILGKVFGYFFELINESAGKALFIPDDAAIGDTYDDDQHIRTRKGSVQGKIKEIELIGYKHAGSGKIIRKTIVTVG
ncbi:MAG: hypothetical protein K2O14_13410 [Oscillospiraceae bacterium]|nr:hypothetical protein [Oscillospiraceae bacterium]